MEPEVVDPPTAEELIASSAENVALDPSLFGRLVDSQRPEFNESSDHEMVDLLDLPPDEQTDW